MAKKVFTIIRQLNFNEPKLNEIANIQPKSIDLQLQYNQKVLLESNLQFWNVVNSKGLMASLWVAVLEFIII